ncbi:Tubulin polyglutamylase complex subunit 2 [Acipenser ruthenus]|uniref:Tubulin polyglutamylase complex subunit 2 n=1 Tax=Acipenser ruthenus TaxID=7906 RepID=A0A444UYW0_ACIRT|nr:Tubulin polyglutamylase complex subunit 2 [Acipenser ruthenus]
MNKLDGCFTSSPGYSTYLNCGITAVAYECSQSIPVSLQQWSCLYRPITSSCDPHTDQGEPFLNKLDPNRAFRGKAKLPTPKKKIATQSTGAQRGRNVGASAARK